MLSLAGNALRLLRKSRPVEEETQFSYDDLFLQIEELNHDCNQLSRKIAEQIDTIEGCHAEMDRLKSQNDSLRLANFSSGVNSMAREVEESEAHATTLVGALVAARNYVPESNTTLLRQIDKAIFDAPGSVKVLDQIRRMDGALYQIQNTDWYSLGVTGDVVDVLRSVAKRGLDPAA